MTNQVSRRHFLCTGGLACLGLGLPDLLRASQRPAAPATSCILVYLYGGASHLDTWDMKPEAPAEIRGEFRPASTKVPGIHYCELLPRLGQHADCLTVVRAMTHDQVDHDVALGFVLSGTRLPSAADQSIRPNATPADLPSLPAVVNRYAAGDSALRAVALPHSLRRLSGQLQPGQGAGLLGRTYDPWLIDQDPNGKNFRVEGLSLLPELSQERVSRRQGLLAALEEAKSTSSTASVPWDRFHHLAHDLLTSRKTQEAFRLEAESDSARNQFGRTTFGQSCLLACRLIEAGVRLVQVNMGNRLDPSGLHWDTHKNNFGMLRQSLLPVLDGGLSGLLTRLRESGQLERTLVVCMGEFGRSPRIEAGGRDHWPQCYSILLAGAGLRGGTHGASDKVGALPALHPTTPEQLAATVLHVLGIDPEMEIHDPQQRPLRLIHGKPLLQLFS